MFPPFSFSLFAVITCTGLGLLAHASLGTWWLFFLGWNPKSGISRTEHANGCLKLCPMLLKCLLKAVVVLMSPPGPTHVQSPGLGEALLLQGSPCNVGDLGSIPGLGRSPGEGKDYPLQYSGLENSMDCIVHGVAKSRIGLSDFHFQPFKDN